MLLRDALMSFLRARAGSVRAANVDDLEDLASTKALELLVRAESGQWSPEGRHEGEVAAYVAAVAKHALLRWAEQRQRQPLALVTDADAGLPRRTPPAPSGPPSDGAVEAREFVEALQACVGHLKPRSRRVWFFRAFYDMGSREIASHPDVGLNAAHVDVLVNRVRDALKTCLAARGLQPRDYPLGAFSALWEGLAGLAQLREPSALAEEADVS